MRLSGLQKEVLALYRQCLRESRKKPAATRSNFQAFARSEFDKSIKIDKRDFAAIEYLLRKGRRQLDKGSPCRPKNHHTSPAYPEEKASQQHPQAPIFRTYSPEPVAQARPRQRRISRTKNGIHVSRRLPERGSRGSKIGNPTSLMPAAEFMDYPYFGTSHYAQQMVAMPLTLFLQGNAPRGDLLYDGAFEGALPTLKRHDANQAATTRQPARKRAPAAIDTQREKRRLERQKHFGLSDPAVWNAMNRTLAQQQHLSSKRNGEPRPRARRSRHRPRVPSRNSSQNRTLNRFARQLEKYADAADAKGKAPVITPTESESRASLHTVEPLLPYHKEFQSAGLAVTSSEQGQKYPSAKSAQPVQPSHKLPRNARPKPEENAHNQDHSVSTETSSCGSSILFTHPDEFYLIDQAPPPRIRPKRETRCSDGIKLPCLGAKPAVTEPRHGRQDPTLRVRTAKDARRPSPNQQAEDLKAVDQTVFEAPKSQITRKNRTSPRQPEKRCRHYASEAPGEHPVRQVAKPQIHPLGPAIPIKVQGSGAPSTKPNFISHPLCDNSSAITSKREPPTMEPPPPKHPSRGSRPATNRPLPPYPDSIREETEPFMAGALRRTSPAKRVSKRKSPEATHKQQREKSPQTNASSMPSLPTEARLAASTESSLERALDAVMKKLDEMEMRQAAIINPAPTAAVQEKINQPKSLAAATLVSIPGAVNSEVAALSSQPSKSPRGDHILSLSPSTKLSPKEFPPKSLSRPSASSRGPSPSKGKSPALAPVGEKSSSRRKESATALPWRPRRNRERGLRDLEVFFDDDDASISDKDVLRGLQIATLAAADDFYDAYIRYKTGLRIRRFLADLKSVDVLQREDALGPRRCD